MRRLFHTWDYGIQIMYKAWKLYMASIKIIPRSTEKVNKHLGRCWANNLLSYHFALKYIDGLHWNKTRKYRKSKHERNHLGLLPIINNLRLCITYQVSSHFAMYQMFVMLNIDRRWPSLGQGPLRQMDGIATKCWFSKWTLCKLSLAFQK